MKRYGIFLKPNSDIYQFINKEKKKYKSLKNKQNFINDIPHLTLFHGIFDDQKKLVDKFNNIKFNKDEVINFQISRPYIFFNDHEVGFNTLVYLIEKSESLCYLQKKLLEKFNPFFAYDFFNLEKKYITNLKKYNYPFVGDSYMPHITITNIQSSPNSDLCNSFLNREIKLSGQFESIFLAEITNYIKIIKEKKNAL